MSHLDCVYAQRFGDDDARAKDRIWVEIGRYLQRYVDSAAPVLDIACDRGYFIRNIRADEKWASDTRDVSTALTKDVRFVQSSGLDLGRQLPGAHFGTVFMLSLIHI